MKMSNGIHTIECIPFVKNIWERDGFKEISESEVMEQFEELKDVEYSDPIEELTWQELKTLAKEKGINTRGMKKEEVIEALK